MLFKNILVASCMALSAAAASNGTSAAADVQYRLAQLDLGYKHTTLMLNHLTSKSGDVTADDVVSSYNKTATAEDKALNKDQPTAPFPDAIQLVLCGSFQSLTLSGIELNNAFVDNADSFNKDQRNTLQEAFTKVNDETGSFFSNVSKKVLPLCTKTLKLDDSAIYESLTMVIKALDPSEASS